MDWVSRTESAGEVRGGTKNKIFNFPERTDGVA